MNFVSTKYRQLRVVLDPKSHIEIQGKRITKGLYDKFKNGLVIEFQDGEFKTDDQRVIEALKSARGFGVDYITEGLEVEVPSDEAVEHINAKKEVAESTRTTCQFCGKKFRKEFELNAHIEAEHKNAKVD